MALEFGDQFGGANPHHRVDVDDASLEVFGGESVGSAQSTENGGPHPGVLVVTQGTDGGNVTSVAGHGC